jgi:hypothetical protein
MASNNKGKALKKSVNNPISVGESSVSLKNRIEWTIQEENFLVDEFALRRVSSYTRTLFDRLFCILTAAFLLLAHSPRCPRSCRNKRRKNQGME